MLCLLAMTVAHKPLSIAAHPVRLYQGKVVFDWTEETLG